MKQKILFQLFNNYPLEPTQNIDVIDSSIDDQDLRFTYIIDRKYVLHCYGPQIIEEAYAQDIQRLVENHRQIGVWAPRLILRKDQSGYVTPIKSNAINLSCYLEEYAPFELLDPDKVDLYQFKEKSLEFLGRLANQFTNKHLSHRYSMWSIIDLPPFMTEIDEKQENFNELCQVLPKDSFVHRLIHLNQEARSRIQLKRKELPRCVFQGDLNPSNILVDQQQNFKGIIDFNLAGTEVNINCFLNESMYFMTQEDLNQLEGKAIFAKLLETQTRLMESILSAYSLNELEKELLPSYQFIIQTGFYPNVQQLIQNIEYYPKKVAEYLEAVCVHYLDSLQ